MPRIKQFTNELAASSARTMAGVHSPRVSGADFGAQIGAAQVQAGGAFAGVGDRMYAEGDRRQKEAEAEAEREKAKRDREKLATALATADFTSRELAIREAAGPNAEGYREAVLDNYDEWVDAEADKIEDPDVRSEFRTRLLSERRNVSSRSATWQQQTEAENANIRSNDAIMALDNRIRTQPDQYEELLAKGADVIAAQSDIPAVVREQMQATWRQNAASARFDGALENAETVGQLDALEAEMRGGAAWLDNMAPAALSGALSKIDTTRRAFQTRADADARAAVADLVARAADINVLIPQEELAAAQSLVRKSDNPVTQAQMARIVRGQELTRQHRASSPSQIRQHRARVVDSGSTIPTAQREELRDAGADFGVGTEFMARVAGNTSLSDVSILPGLRDENINLAGKTRSLPVSDEFKGALSGVVRSLGDEYDVQVTSGGQLSEAELQRRGIPRSEWGHYRTGSHRHDVDGSGKSGTADVVLLRNGKPVTPDQDPALYERFFEAAAPYFPGMGHYSWGVHVGGGGTAFWGPDKSAATANPQFAAAARRGRQGGSTANVDPDFMDRALATPGVAAMLGNDKSPARVLAAYASVTRTYMTEFLGRPVSDEELYMAVRVGRDEAVRLAQGYDERDGTAMDAYRRYVSDYAAAGPRDGVTASDYAASETLGALEARALAGVKADMIGYADASGAFTFGDLDEPGGFQRRSREARMVADYYSVPATEVEPFSKAEETALTERMRKGDADEVLAIIGEIQTMQPDMAAAAFRQLNQDNEVFAYAGGMMNGTGEAAVAGDIVRGQKRIEENPAIKRDIGATDEDINTAFLTATGNALYDVSPGQRQAIMEAAMAHYVETHVTRNAGEGFDQNAYTASINAVLSGRRGQAVIEDVNGQDVVLPPGVTGRQLETALSYMTVEDWTRLSVTKTPPMYADGTLADPEELEDEAAFRAIGNGQYRVAASDGSYLVTGRARGGRLEAFVVQLSAAELQNVIERGQAGEMRNAETLEPEPGEYGGNPWGAPGR